MGLPGGETLGTQHLWERCVPAGKNVSVEKTQDRMWRSSYFESHTVLLAFSGLLLEA